MQVVGGLCALVGVFILTLPIPIVVNSFAAYYKNRLWRNEVAHKRAERMKRQTATNMEAAPAGEEMRRISVIPSLSTSPAPKLSSRRHRAGDEEETTLISSNGIGDLGQGSLSHNRSREIKEDKSGTISHSDVHKCPHPDSKN